MQIPSTPASFLRPAARGQVPVAQGPAVLIGTPGTEPAGVQFVREADFLRLMAEMPKAELHTHIEGSVRPETILDIAKEYELELPAPTVDKLKDRIGMKPGEDLVAFLKKFEPFRYVFERPATLERLAYETIEDNADENVQYTEIRINPKKNTEKVSIDQVLDSTLAGMKRACDDLGVDARLIVSINRSYSVDSAMEVARAAVARMDTGVVALDLAGDEAHNPVEKFKPVFDYAHAQGLNITIHAGEAAGPSSIQNAMQACHATRIGHGVRLQEDPELLRQVQQQGVALEMCPTSNMLLNVTPDLGKYPLKHYHHQGVITTINTDDRHIFGVTLAGEYTVLARKTGMSLQELQAVAANAPAVAFLPPEEKQALQQRFSESMREFNRKLPSRLYSFSGEQQAA